jgi:hypothetical protein
MGEYNTREAKVEQDASLSEIESLTQVEAAETEATEATEARQHIKATKRKQRHGPRSQYCCDRVFLFMNMTTSGQD